MTTFLVYVFVCQLSTVLLDFCLLVDPAFHFGFVCHCKKKKRRELNEQLSPFLTFKQVTHKIFALVEQ